MIELKIKESDHIISVEADGLPPVWFYKDELVLNIPSPTVKSAKEARLFAAVIEKAADELEKRKVYKSVSTKR